jgi:hypothetical protein
LSLSSTPSARTASMNAFIYAREHNEHSHVTR